MITYGFHVKLLGLVFVTVGRKIHGISDFDLGFCVPNYIDFVMKHGSLYNQICMTLQPAAHRLRRETGHTNQADTCDSVGKYTVAMFRRTNTVVKTRPIKTTASHSPAGGHESSLRFCI